MTTSAADTGTFEIEGVEVAITLDKNCSFSWHRAPKNAPAFKASFVIDGQRFSSSADGEVEHTFEGYDGENTRYFTIAELRAAALIAERHTAWYEAWRSAW